MTNSTIIDKSVSLDRRYFRRMKRYLLDNKLKYCLDTDGVAWRLRDIDDALTDLRIKWKMLLKVRN